MLYQCVTCPFLCCGFYNFCSLFSRLEWALYLMFSHFDMLFLVFFQLAFYCGDIYSFDGQNLHLKFGHWSPKFHVKAFT